MRPKLGAIVKAGAVMVKAKYKFDEDLPWTEDDGWVAGPRWVREAREIEGVYCGVKTLHQAKLRWEESRPESDRDAFLDAIGEDESIYVYLVALDHRRRVCILPRDVEVPE